MDARRASGEDAMGEPVRPPEGQPTVRPEEGEESLLVPLLLALAAAVAAVLGARAALVSSSASGAWQTSVRQEVKRSAALVEDVRYVYAVEAPVALDAAAAAIEAEELRQAAETLAGDDRAAVEAEALVRQTSADALVGAFDLTQDPKYRAADGYDVAARLADVRDQYPDLVALAPDASMDAGDEASRHARRLVAATIPVAVAFLFGALAQGFPRYRTRLAVAGFAVLAVGVGIGVLAEVGGA
jgi:hypothetical protein